MSISTKMTLSLVTVGTLLFGVYSVFLLRTEEQELRRAVRAELRLLGRSVQVAVENALRDRQIADIKEIVNNLHKIAPTVHLLVFDTAGESSVLTAGAQASLHQAREVAQRAGADRTLLIEFVPPNALEHLVLGLPLSDDDGNLLGQLAVVRPLEDLQRDLTTTRRGALHMVMIFFVITVGVGFIMGFVHLRKPLRRLAEGMRRVRTGDLSSILAVQRNDEVGMVSREFNAMVADLAIARTRLESQEAEKRELLRALQQADKLITVGQLSAGLAHEIGSPLQVLNGRARDLLLSGHDPERTRRNAEILVQQADRIARVVEQLLSFARRRPARMERIDLTAAVGDVVDLLQIEARRKMITLTAKLGIGLSKVVADLDQIQQMLANLITNSLAATPREGKIEVSVDRIATTGAGSVLIEAAQLCVTDTGCGIPDDVRDRIFEPFFTTRNTEGGTGLGLAVVKAVVDEHQGTIAIDSSAGLGTRFTVTLPQWEHQP